MTHQKLISFDIKANFGFFKKPDYNNGVLLSYNMLHKPALLGILGSMLGMAGYQRRRELPEYYLKLHSLPIGIKPLGDEQGNFQKSVTKYTNTVGYANDDGNLLIEETFLIKPAFRCYLLLDMQKSDHEAIYKCLQKGAFEFIPYFGKNEYQAWTDAFQEYSYTSLLPDKEYNIETIFIKEGKLKEQKVAPKFSFTLDSMGKASSFCYFERLPISLNPDLMQYEMAEFAFTNWTLQANTEFPNLYQVTTDSGSISTIQLF